jgi:hypothetical protein
MKNKDDDDDDEGIFIDGNKNIHLQLLIFLSR